MRLFLSLIALLAASAANGRELTVDEKEKIILAASAVLINPDGAQFKWMPVVGIDGLEVPVLDHISAKYCGLVNQVMINGRYEGFKPFLTSVRWMKDINGKTHFFVSSYFNVEDRWHTASTMCREYGYTDFSIAR